MTRVFLAAGVAALAIAAPATAGPHGGGKDRQAAVNQNGGGGGGHQARAQAVQRGGGGGGGHAMRQSFERPQHAQRMASVERPQRHQQARAQNVSRAQTRMAAREQTRVNRGHAQNQAQVRVAERQQVRTNHAQAQNRVADRQQLRANHAQNRMADRQQLRANQAQNRMADRQQLRANNRMVQNDRLNRDQLRNDRQMAAQDRMANRDQLRADRQMASRNLLADRRALRADRIANADVFRTSRIARSLALAPRTQFIDPVQAVRFVDQPITTVNSFVPLMALPASVSYLYPNTPNYYYQYGGGYLYQVDRSSSLINALIPLLAGGFLPGTYLPQAYMGSYVPSYYGLNSFYPSSYNYGYGAATYGGYGYGYQNLCNRYAYGVVYQVDCYSGMVQNVIPTYAGGYGVGQLLPSAYSYYNVPMQYRSMYYPQADYSYWYAPGAIYQYDTSSSLITSVAALMSPGFAVGQPLPMGYSMYNVPMSYRATYYDTPDAWYRYNNGYIYQVDPSTMLVSAVVASLLT